jgi:raffinose/stachyose/melibiose transport system permease protein
MRASCTAIPDGGIDVSDRKKDEASSGGSGRKRVRDWTRAPFILLCLLPAFLFLAVFLYYPIAETFRLAMTKSSGMGPEEYIGFDNYVKLFADEEFLAGLLHVIQWAFWSVIIQLPLAFLIAFSLTYYANKMTGPLRSIYYLSNVLPSAITAMLGRFIFTPQNGIISNFAKAVGWNWLASIDFLGNPNLAFWSVFAIATWAYTGFPIIYLMARIEQIPTEVKEAAELDGATGWRYARSIVLPDLGYPFRILAVLATVGSLKLFDLPYIMVAGGPGHATKTLGIALYLQGFVNWNYGRAAAIGVVIFVLSLGFTIAQFSLGRAKGEDRK